MTKAASIELTNLTVYPSNDMLMSVYHSRLLMNTSAIAAIVLAADRGFQPRSALKPLAPCGSTPVIEQAVRLFRLADVDNVIVVAAPRLSTDREAFARLGAPCIIDSAGGTNLPSLIQAGMHNLPGHPEAFFLLPASYPLVRPQSVLALVRAYRETKAGILYPAFMGKRGCPPLVSRPIARQIATRVNAAYMSSLLAPHDHQAADIPVADECIHLAMNTRTGLLQLRRRYEHYEIPSDRECRSLLEKWQVPAHIVAHCRAVTRTADRLAKALLKAGCRVDAALVHAAALLHDCAKTSPGHAQAGAQLVEDEGFKRTAAVIARHMDIDFAPGDPLTETHILYLADKLVCDTVLTSLDERLAIMLPRHRGTARQVIIRRFEVARHIQQSVEMTTGAAISTILGTCRCTRPCQT